MDTDAGRVSAPPRRTAFVLTGGGSLGAVQVGMVAALQDHGITPDVLVGTSVGAVNAAHLAGPGPWPDRVGELTELWLRLRRSDVFAVDPRRWLRAGTGSSPSLFSGAPLRRLLAGHLGYRALEEAQRGLAVTATDVVTGAGPVLDRGPVVDAVAASAAVPGLLPPVAWRGRALVDGAVGHPAALDHADRRGVDDIYLLPAGYPCAGREPSGALAIALTALTLLLHTRLVDEVDRYAGDARLHVVPSLCPLAVSPADFTRADELIERTRAHTSVWLRHDEVRDPEPSSTAGLALHGPHAPGRQPRPPRTARRSVA
ncbi:patatin-like phospholipase family protein [Rothia sp. ARF10]|nr:patatin-like phospholipase family protein [Rothia sp. ARF10]